ncbi:hypothetical protein Pan189_39610 [Stratiformator vulcanicus]|uniref:Uncharacterized protein n=1 Tax=Stratiformator vulcanicus TaxID=2527980 RepID=A0A517R6T2_9PLAN|nr:hypothetical protein Pan189_39610 [Stratiformator vulcanicus]
MTPERAAHTANTNGSPVQSYQCWPRSHTVWKCSSGGNIARSPISKTASAVVSAVECDKGSGSAVGLTPYFSSRISRVRVALVREPSSSARDFTSPGETRQYSFTLRTGPRAETHASEMISCPGCLSTSTVGTRATSRFDRTRSSASRLGTSTENLSGASAAESPAIKGFEFRYETAAIRRCGRLELFIGRWRPRLRSAATGWRRIIARWVFAEL